jgi:predicted Fe-Mo cluster-binding NifX family protein
MKIVLSTLAPQIDSQVDPRFGRGAYLLVVDTESDVVEGQPNPGLDSPAGAGIQAAQFAANQKAQAVISGDFGPHAFNALQAANISMYLYEDCQTAAEAVERFKAGTLKQVWAATRAECDGGHHG